MESRLIVELDGLSHAGAGSQDDQRSAVLARMGYRVLRIRNDDVLQCLEAVLLLIAREAGHPLD